MASGRARWPFLPWQLAGILGVAAACVHGGGNRTPVGAVASPPPDALSVAESLSSPANRSLHIAAWLVEHAPDCRCPPDVPCSACPPPYARFADGPTIASGDPMLFAEMTVDSSLLPVGRRYLVTGRWSQEPDTEWNERILLVEEIALLQ